MIRKALQKDYDEILRLNQADVEMLSPLDYELLEKMNRLTEVFNVFEIDDNVVGFIMAFKDGCEYWSDNYHWFLENYTNFLYIDRIVIDKDHRNNGIAQKFYENLFEHASDEDYDLVCAEIDIEPEYNHQSIRFHEKMGFHEVGTRISKQTLTVSLQIREID